MNDITRLNNRSSLRARMELPVFTEEGGLKHHALASSPTEATTIAFHDAGNTEPRCLTMTERSEDIPSARHI